MSVGVLVSSLAAPWPCSLGVVYGVRRESDLPGSGTVLCGCLRCELDQTGRCGADLLMKLGVFNATHVDAYR